MLFPGQVMHVTIGGTTSLEEINIILLKAFSTTITHVSLEEFEEKTLHANLEVHRIFLIF